MQWRHLFVPAAFASLCACALITGAADLEVGPEVLEVGAPEGDSATTEAGDETVDAGVDPLPTCTSPSRCLTAPAGWEGPFAVLVERGSSSANACPGGFARSWERVGVTDASAPPAQCACSCSGIGGSCDVVLVDYEEQGCSGNLKSRVLPLGACVPPASGADGWKASAVPRASCAADASTTFVPLEAGTAAVGCRPSDPAGCETGACVPPTPQGARLCVRSDDASVCPSGWTAPVSLAQGLEDTRGCSPCTCAATTPACSFTYTLYDTADCTGGGTSVSTTACRTAGGVDSLKLGSASLSGTCTPSGGQPVGKVTSAAAVVLCCQP